MKEDIQQAVNNINSVLFQGRIEMPEGALTAREHQQLSADFKLLVTLADLAAELEAKLEKMKEVVNVDETEDSK